MIRSAPESPTINHPQKGGKFKASRIILLSQFVHLLRTR